MVVDKSYGERFDYFLSRWPYMTGFGFIPAVCLLLSYYELVNCSWLFLPMTYIMLFQNTRALHVQKLDEQLVDPDNKKGWDTVPKYSRYIPYTKTTWTVDP